MVLPLECPRISGARAKEPLWLAPSFLSSTSGVSVGKEKAVLCLKKLEIRILVRRGRHSQSA